MSTLVQRSVLDASGFPLDQIQILGIAARGFHGVLESEREAGQDFSADVTLYLDTRAAARDDDLDETVNYALVAQDVVDILSGAPVDLIETVAEQIAAAVLDRPLVASVDVTVHKPQAPIPVPFSDVTVTINRDRLNVPVVVSPVAPALDEVPAEQLVPVRATEGLAEPSSGVSPSAAYGAEATDGALLPDAAPAAAATAAAGATPAAAAPAPGVGAVALPAAALPAPEVLPEAFEPVALRVDEVEPDGDVETPQPSSSPTLDLPLGVLAGPVAARESDPASYSASELHLESDLLGAEGLDGVDEGRVAGLAEPGDPTQQDLAPEHAAPFGRGIPADLTGGAPVPPLDEAVLEEQARLSEEARRPEAFGLRPRTEAHERPTTDDARAETPVETADEALTDTADEAPAEADDLLPTDAPSAGPQPGAAFFAAASAAVLNASRERAPLSFEELLNPTATGDQPTASAAAPLAVPARTAETPAGDDSVAEPSAGDPSAAESSTTEPSAAEPSTTEPGTAEVGTEALRAMTPDAAESAPEPVGGPAPVEVRAGEPAAVATAVAATDLEDPRADGPRDDERAAPSGADEHGRAVEETGAVADPLGSDVSAVEPTSDAGPDVHAAPSVAAVLDAEAARAEEGTRVPGDERDALDAAEVDQPTWQPAVDDVPTWQSEVLGDLAEEPATPHEPDPVLPSVAQVPSASSLETTAVLQPLVLDDDPQADRDENDHDEANHDEVHHDEVNDGEAGRHEVDRDVTVPDVVDHVETAHVETPQVESVPVGSAADESRLDVDDDEGAAQHDATTLDETALSETAPVETVPEVTVPVVTVPEEGSTSGYASSESVPSEPVAYEPRADETAVLEPVRDDVLNGDSGQPAADEPAHEEPADHQPAAEQPVDEQASDSQPLGTPVGAYEAPHGVEGAAPFVAVGGFDSASATTPTSPVPVTEPRVDEARVDEAPAPEVAADGAGDPGETTVLPVQVDRMDARPEEPVEVVLALGANLGDAQATLRRAVAELDTLTGVDVVEVGPLARTAAVGGPEQPDFLNTVVIVRTTLSPRELLHGCQSVEAGNGRERDVRWGPRTLDIDLVVYGDVIGSAPDLELPHPRANERAFVLAPWAHLAPEAHLPGLGGGPVAALAATAHDREGIRWLALDWLHDAEVPTAAQTSRPAAVAPALTAVQVVSMPEAGSDEEAPDGDRAAGEGSSTSAQGAPGGLDDQEPAPGAPTPVGPPAVQHDDAPGWSSPAAERTVVAERDDDGPGATDRQL